MDTTICHTCSTEIPFKCVRTPGTYRYKKFIQVTARGLGSVVKHSTADPGIASSIPPRSN